MILEQSLTCLKIVIDFLLLLLEGETDKQNIINQVWHEQRGSVSDSSYYGQIYMLRKSFDQIGLEFVDKNNSEERRQIHGGVLRENKSIPDLATENRINVMPLATATGFTEELISPLDSVGYPTHSESSGTGKEWYHSRRWNIFISVLALLAVCWISTLIVIVIFFFG